VGSVEVLGLSSFQSKLQETVHNIERDIENYFGALEAVVSPLDLVLLG
jgi:hypothetical protein